MSHADKIEAIQRSAVILGHARAGNWIAAGDEVGELAERFDGPGIQILICGLADTMLYHQGGHCQPDEIARPIWLDETGFVDNADDVTRPEVVWAGRFIAARAALDEDACAALVDSCADDLERYCDNVLAVLEATATTLNLMGVA